MVLTVSVSSANARILQISPPSFRTRAGDDGKGDAVSRSICAPREHPRAVCFYVMQQTTAGECFTHRTPATSSQLLYILQPDTLSNTGNYRESNLWLESTFPSVPSGHVFRCYECVLFVLFFRYLFLGSSATGIFGLHLFFSLSLKFAVSNLSLALMSFV